MKTIFIFRKEIKKVETGAWKSTLNWRQNKNVVLKTCPSNLSWRICEEFGGVWASLGKLSNSREYLTFSLHQSDSNVEYNIRDLGLRRSQTENTYNINKAFQSSKS